MADHTCAPTGSTIRRLAWAMLAAVVALPSQANVTSGGDSLVIAARDASVTRPRFPPPARSS
jgi:hypothetical protein